MPDGDFRPHSQQQQPFHNTHGPVFDHPGVNKPAGGVARAIAFARGLSGKAVVLAVVVFGLQAFMPPGSKPSDLIGSFHGSTEKAEIEAKKTATVRYEQDMTTARVVPT